MKNICLLLVIALLSSCEKKSGTKNANINLVNEYFDHFNKHEWKEMAAMYAPMADFKDPSLGKGIVAQSQKQTEEKYRQLNEIFPDIHDQVVKIYPSGENEVIVEFVSTGTAPDSSAFQLPICTIFTFDKGKIISDFTYYDNFGEEQGK